MAKDIMYYMCESRTLAKITIDYGSSLSEAPSVAVENFVTEPYLRPFGVRECVSYQDFLCLLEGRCFPKSRANAKQLLRDAGIDFYDPMQIVKKTHGVMSDDFFWIRFDNEDSDLWETINPRRKGDV